MAQIYLSPSTQEFNKYVNGGTEEYYMNLIADKMEPYLKSNGIKYVRNTTDMTSKSSVEQSNEGNYDLHLAIHSNAAPEGKYGEIRGTDVYFSPNSKNGENAAYIIADNFKSVYPDSNLVRAVPTTAIGEVTKTKAPAVLVEVAYHDNEKDADWIKENIDEIARNLVISLTEYFGLPFVEAQMERIGTVNLDAGYLNIRSKPSTTAAILGIIENNSEVVVLGQSNNWCVVNYNGIIGYASFK